MDHFKETKNCLPLQSEGKLEVVPVTPTDFKYLQAIHSCLGDLFVFIEEENKRLGYSFAQDDASQCSEKKVVKDTYTTRSSETKLRPLINYEYQQPNVSENEMPHLNPDHNAPDMELSA